MRKRVNVRRDKKMFNKTANQHKKINVSPSIMRGGIRL